MSITPNTPGSRLRELRAAAGLSASALSVKIGCAPSAITNHEHGINGIRADTAAAYAEALGSTPQWILYGDGERGDPPRQSRPEGAAVLLHQLANGKARLQVNKVVPMALALRILTMIEEGGE